MKKNNFRAYLYLAPAMLIFIVFLFYPFLKTVYLSLYKTDRNGQAKLFNGAGHYLDIFTSEEFLNSLKVTVIFVFIVVVVSMAIGLLTALLCRHHFPGVRFFSLAYALPMAIASSSAALVFKIMLHPTIGIINKITGSTIYWIQDPHYALLAVSLLTAWLNSGINFLYFSAGLSAINPVLYERAQIDGANSWQQFRHITLPGLMPIVFYTLVINIIQAFQSFGQVKILTEGGPVDSTNLIVYSIYRNAFFNYRFGRAAAESVVLFGIVMLLTLILFAYENKHIRYD